MEIKAQLNYLRIAPRKVRMLADLVRGKSVEQSEALLGFAVKKGSLPLLKLLKQGAANAKNNFKIDSALLYVSKITVDEGPKSKRFMARARGQAGRIQKKTSHITLVLKERKPAAKKTRVKKTDLKKSK
jgi:large subunit ribosomal protein L22